MKIKSKKMKYLLILGGFMTVFILGICYASVHEGNYIYVYKYIKKLEKSDVGIVKMSENKYLAYGDESNEGITYLFESNGYVIETFWNHGSYRKKGEAKWKGISGEYKLGHCIWTIPNGEVLELKDDNISQASMAAMVILKNMFIQ